MFSSWDYFLLVRLIVVARLFRSQETLWKLSTLHNLRKVSQVQSLSLFVTLGQYRGFTRKKVRLPSSCALFTLGIPRLKTIFLQLVLSVLGACVWTLILVEHLRLNCVSGQDNLDVT